MAYDINLSNGNILTTLHQLEVNGPDNRSTPRLIQAIKPKFPVTFLSSAGVDKITVPGHVNEYFPTGVEFQIVGSTSNNGTYTVLGASTSTGPDNTIIDITGGSIPSVGTVDGEVEINAFVLAGDISYRFVPGFAFDVENHGPNDGTYNVSAFGAFEGHGNTIIQTAAPIANEGAPFGQIIYNAPETCSTLKLPGKGIMNYGEMLIENLVRMTENWASDDEPQANANIIGIGPTPTPLVGQQWYRTTSGNEGFLYWDGSEWTTSWDVDSGALIFKDVEDGDKDILITANETDLPAPFAGTAKPGMVVWSATNPPNDNPVFRVLSAEGNELLNVENNTVANTGYIRTVNNLEIQSTGNSLINGSLGIGADGTPTIDKTLSVEGNGISVNADLANHAELKLNGPAGMTSRISFQTNNTQHAQIYVTDTSNYLYIASNANTDITAGTGVDITATANDVNVTGAANVNIEGTSTNVNITAGTLVDVTGATRFNDPVGINNVPPSGTPVWLEVTGDIQANSQIRGSDQSAASPTFTFTNHLDTGMYHDTAANELGFAVDGNKVLGLKANGLLNVASTTDYETLVTSDDDVPNKRYVDDAIKGISWREPVDVVSQQSYADSSFFPTSGTIDGETITTGMRVIFNEVTNVADRDLWIFDGATWQRSPYNTRTFGDTVYIKYGNDKGKIYSWTVDDEWDIISVKGGGTFFTYESFTATAGLISEQFTLVNPYKPSVDGNKLMVYVDGVKYIYGLGYNEDDTTHVTLYPPDQVNGWDGTETVEFYVLSDVATTGSLKHEYQTGLTITSPGPISLTTMSYVPNSDGLMVYFNGQKMISGIDYTEITPSTIQWTGINVTPSDHFEFYSGVPVVAGTLLSDIDNVSPTIPNDGEIMMYNATLGVWEPSIPDILDNGAYLDEIVATASIIYTTTNVATKAKDGLKAYQQVFVNGLLQIEGSNYTVTGTNEITFSVAPPVGANITIYQL